MKKIILIIFFSLVIAVFVSFNYLLWERESREKDIKNLQDINSSNSITINILNRQLENLDNSLKIKDESINRLNEENNKLKKDLEKLNQDYLESIKVITRKNETISYFYENLQNINPDVIEAPIKKWAEYINNGDYESAYKTFYVNKEEEKETFADFTNKYKDKVKSIEIKSIAFCNNEIENQYGVSMLQKGDVFFTVELDVKLVENVNDKDVLFINGSNHKIFGLQYNTKENKWHISNIFEID